MARDYELADHTFWSVAEAALRVRYDEAVLEVKDELGRDEPISATVSRARGSKDWRSGDEHEVWFLNVRATDQETAIQNLKEKCREHLLRAGFATMLQALPQEEAARLERYATLFLEARHSVVISSKGTTVEELANNIKQRWYADLVRDHVEEIKDAIKDGEITTSEEVYDRIREMEVIYTSQAQDVLRFSQNDTAYWEEMGGEAPSWAVVASYALQADVLKDLGFDPGQIHEVDCPRCGTVVSTEDESDETDCPKCGIDLDTEIREGYFDPGPPGALPDEESKICQDCSDEQDGATNRLPPVRIPPEQEFDCHACDRHFLTGKPSVMAGTRVLVKGQDADLCALCGEKPDAIPGSPIPPGTRFTCYDCGDTHDSPVIPRAMRAGRRLDTHAPHAMCSSCIAEDPERMPENRTVPIPAGTKYECVQCHKPFMTPSPEI